MRKLQLKIIVISLLVSLDLMVISMVISLDLIVISLVISMDLMTYCLLPPGDLDLNVDLGFLGVCGLPVGIPCSLVVQKVGRAPNPFDLAV